MVCYLFLFFVVINNNVTVGCRNDTYVCCSGKIV